MKDIHPTVVALQARMFAERLKVNEVFRRAGSAQSTWTRWKNGAEPKLSTLQKVERAIDAKIAERDSRQPRGAPDAAAQEGKA